jgi:Ca-activated chloride channel homolog
VAKALTLLASFAFFLMAFCSDSHAQYYGTVQQNTAQLQAERSEVQTILIILDASDSMNELLGGQSKMQTAKNVVLQTVKNLPANVKVGLRVYGHKTGSGGFVFRGPFGSYASAGTACKQSQLVVPPAINNRGTIASQLLNIQAVGKTPITFSLTQAVQSDLAGISGKKTIILVSDGRETCDADPCQLALQFVRAGIDVKINTIGFGTNDRYANSQLRCVALSTKGKFFEANSADELAKSLRDSFAVQTSVQARIESSP